MKTNIGTIDRILRVIVGIGLISLAFIGPQTPWGWIGVVPLLTALVGWCPAYVPFGISSCSKDRATGRRVASIELATPGSPTAGRSAIRGHSKPN
jgi:hypothetical protein